MKWAKLEKEDNEEIIKNLREKALEKHEKCKNCDAKTKEVLESHVRCTWRSCRKLTSIWEETIFGGARAGKKLFYAL